MNDRLADNEYLLGANYTIVDAYAITILNWTPSFIGATTLFFERGNNDWPDCGDAALRKALFKFFEANRLFDGFELA